MLEGLAIITKDKSTVYVYLLNEGSDVWRPVPAEKVDELIYLLGGTDLYDPDDEEWEFLPGSYVRVAEQQLNDSLCLVAVERVSVIWRFRYAGW